MPLYRDFLRLASLIIGIFPFFSYAQEGQVSVSKPLKVVSIDMCADQYVLGIFPQNQVLALSTRAGLSDSYYQDRAKKYLRLRPSLESILALKPDAVVRQWGGDARLLSALKARGIKIVQINDVKSLSQARFELLRVGQELNQQATAMIEARRFDMVLSQFRPLSKNKSILYYTPSGFSAGPDTMEGDILRTLGFQLESQNRGYYYIPTELFLTLKPDAYAVAFYDNRRIDARGVGRHPSVMKRLYGRTLLTFPSRTLACKGWFNAYDLTELGRGVAS